MPNRRSFLTGLAAGVGLLAAAPSVALALAPTGFATRRRFVEAVRGGLSADAGTVVVAGERAYLATPAATAIPDLPGWLPFSAIEVEHFGAVGDLVVATDAAGYVRSAGSDDRAAFEAADRYAAQSGIGAFHARGDYYLAGELRLTSRLLCDGPARSRLWLHYGRADVLERGIWLAASNAGISGFDLIGQYDIRTAKPRNNGNFGSIVSAGDYYTPDEQRPVRNLSVAVRMCRAAHVAGQVSRASSMCSAVGRTADSSFALGTHGRTNVASNLLFAAHWGCVFDPRSVPTDQPDKTPGRILETYHPSRLKIDVTTEIDNRQGHGFSRVFELSAAAACRVGDIRAVGLRTAYWISPGDVVDAFAAAEAKGHVNRGHVIGRVRCAETRNQPRDAVALINGLGTSKFETYEGSAVPLVRQAVYDVRVAGHEIETSGAVERTTGLYVRAIRGRVDLGRCRVSGTARSIVVTHSDGDIGFDLAEGDGGISIDHSRGVRVLGSGVTGPLPGRRGRPGAAVSIVGRSRAGRGEGGLPALVVAEPAPAGRRVLKVAPLGEAVFAGDLLIAGELEIRVQGYTSRGGTTVACAALPIELPSGLTLRLEQACRVDAFVGTYHAAADGLVVVDAVVDGCDLSRATAAGRLARAERGAHLALTAPPPAAVVVDARSRAVLATER